MLEKIKKWYKQGLWTAEMVEKAVEKGVISQEDAMMIMSFGKDGENS